MSATRSQVLSLYKHILREGKKFVDYNFRMYAVRRTKDQFRSNKEISDSSKIQELIKEAEENLEIMRRQVLIGQMYGDGKLVIESATQEESKSR
ncbi:hypothetical protein V1264_000935 [Littorina saxatilis]|uniref:Complex 1 LYR protein domain-containing protein n=1 Tax=Littorina saxatilis TaxID=31220 RepID=A0AAN9GQC0_9CAEN